MSFAFPLVRAADIFPVVNWLQRSGRPVSEILGQAQLHGAICETPNRLIALQHALDLLRILGDREGADIGWRMVSGSGATELGPVSDILLGAPTLRAALTRLSVEMARHVTHEQFALVPRPGGAEFTEQMLLNIDPRARHLCQQYVLALLRSLCRLTGYAEDPFGRVEIAPHPELGVAPLAGWLGPDVRASASRKLRVFLPDHVLDRRVPPHLSGADTSEHDRFPALRGPAGYAGTVETYLEHLLAQGREVPSVQWVAAAGGTSLRTMQRRLAEEGTNFSDVLDRVRRDLAMQALVSGQRPIGAIGAGLGYARAPSFTRAVRRWSAQPPRTLRDKAAR
ncbi:AraC family transcriptional regulator [Pseudoruegeria sp. SK021]|uniref:helix-turn-helix domain-containing protein n=1 Tax=Pseudoruegeria sp. SK021 TaxID=1933035 RepID=UPI000A21B1DF|nr:helix-turn-helix domain-containing protein [Pseudoruegeria sp. SK021]OSP55912.1 hypothetical protein BV911_04480 [Pseudoruegeria sp. SK021]